MAKVGSYGAGPQGTNPDDETTPINKDKFKEQLKKVDAVDKTDPDQKSKKRKPGKEEEDIEQAQQAIQAPSVTSHPLLSTSTKSTSAASIEPSKHAKTSVSSEASYTPHKKLSSTTGDEQTDAPQTQASSKAPYTSQQNTTSTPPDQENPPQTSSGSQADNITQFPQQIAYDELDFDTNPPLQTPSSLAANPQTTTTKKPSDTTSTEKKEVKKSGKEKLKPQLPFSKTKEKYRQELKVALEKYEHDLGLTPLVKKQNLQDSPYAPQKKIISDKKVENEEPVFQPQETKKTVEPSKASLEALEKKQKLQSKKREKIEDSNTSELPPSPPLISPINLAPPSPSPAPSASYLSPEVHELFQTMIGLVMIKQINSDTGGSSEMEIALNNPEYSSSKFFGLTIKITEFKSAPGAYNIELVGSASQTQLLEQEKRKLISALNDNRYSLPFTVNRLEVSLKKEDKDFLFKRKESVKGDSNNASDNQTT